MYLRHENGGLVTSILIGNQLIRILFHPVYRWMKADPDDDVSVGHFL